jgi:hypothetical protein
VGVVVCSLPERVTDACRGGPGASGARVRFLGLVEDDSPSRAKAYAAQLGEIYPSLVDHDGALLSRLTLLPPAGIPSTLVLDRSGRMAARVIGAITRPELDQIVKGLTSSS